MFVTVDFDLLTANALLPRFFTYLRKIWFRIAAPKMPVSTALHFGGSGAWKKVKNVQITATADDCNFGFSARLTIHIHQGSAFANASDRPTLHLTCDELANPNPSRLWPQTPNTGQCPLGDEALCGKAIHDQ